MDVLSEVLKKTRLRGTIYFHAAFHAPWGMHIPSGEYANFHIVTRGNCWVRSKKDEPALQLGTGDMILFPHGDPHTLSDSLRSEVINASDFMNTARRGDDDTMVFGGTGGQRCSMICGHFEYHRECSHSLFETLPVRIYISANNSTQTNWFSTASELAAQLSNSNQAGKDVAIDRLAESLFVQALAEHIDRSNDSAGFLAALHDRHIGRALRAMHDAITHNWTLAELSDIAAMSRTVFARRFHQLVGESPIVYLARWRMLKAYELLSDSDMPISEISSQVGYQSEFAFSRAFKKLTGQTPGSVRSSAGDEPGYQEG